MSSRIEASKKFNGSPLSFAQEDHGSAVCAYSGRINDRLSIEVSEACDRFWIKRKLASPFSSTWFALRGMRKDSSIQSKI
jgi:hypothetical protein